MQTEPARTGNADKRLGLVGDRLGYMLHRTDVLCMQLIREELAVLGLTPARATALAFVHENPGRRQNDLGQALGINRSSTMEAVNSLVALGAIIRRSGADRRTNALFLTPRGEQMFEQFVAISQDVDEVIAASLSNDDRAKLIELFTKIAIGLDGALTAGARHDAKLTII